MEGIVMESVWVAVGFAIFVILVWRKAGSALSTMLDARSEKIRTELDEARALREEALDELHQFQRLSFTKIMTNACSHSHEQGLTNAMFRARAL